MIGRARFALKLALSDHPVLLRLRCPPVRVAAWRAEILCAVDGLLCDSLEIRPVQFGESCQPE